MFEDLSLDEARHVLTDFFEIHTEAPLKNASKRARQILEAIEMGEAVELGTVPTLRVGESILTVLPDDYEPDNIYFLRKNSAAEEVPDKKIRIKKK